MCFPRRGTNIIGDMGFPIRGTHINRDMGFLSRGTHNTREMGFPGGGTHITRDMCFPGRGTHVIRNMCSRVENHISLVVYGVQTPCLGGGVLWLLYQLLYLILMILEIFWTTLH